MRTPRTSWRSRAVLLTLAVCACGAPAPTAANDAPPTGSQFAAAPAQQVRLPDALHEISGLALTPDGRLFAHNDERAVLHELDPTEGRVVRSFTVGAPERGDFEGLAITPDGYFWLVTSQGALFRFREGANGGEVAFERFDTGLAEICEVEGLAYLAAEQSLILACKRNHVRAMRDTVAFYAWRPASQDAATLWRSMPEAEITAAADARNFSPSAIEFDPQTGSWFVLSARQGILAEFDDAGNLRAARRLNSDHVQAEGLSLLADGSLVIADEGGDGRALLSVYARAP